MSGTDKRDNQDALPAIGVLADYIEQVRRNIMLDLRVSLPAKVVVYNPADQTATLSVELLPVRYEGEIEVPLPPVLLPPTPVYWMGGSLGYFSTPLIPGDTGMVIFSDRCLSLWLQKGLPTDPVNGRAHDLGDGVFYPGVRTAANKIETSTDLTATVMDGDAFVKVGRNATQLAIKAETFITVMDVALTAAVVAAALITPPAGDGGTAAFVAFQEAWDFAKASIKTTKAKVE